MTKDLLHTMEVVGEDPIGLGRAAALAGMSDHFDFTFSYLGFLFAVKATTIDGRRQVQFRANLGKIPFTSENSNGRVSAMRIVNVAGNALGGNVRITPDQRIMLSDEFWLDEAMTPVLLISITTRLLVRAKPYLEMLAGSVNKPVIAKKF